MPDREAEIINSIAELVKVVGVMIDQIHAMAVKIKELESK